MRQLLIIITILFMGCVEYEVANDEYKWREGEITITLSPTLEELGPAEEIYPLVEESFHEWLDYIDGNITINFVYGKCEFIAKNSCVTMTDYIDDELGHAYISVDTDNYIYGGRIKILRNIDWSKTSLKTLLAHETGHFWGLKHSEIQTDVMYPYIQNEIELSENDIRLIEELYN